MQSAVESRKRWREVKKGRNSSPLKTHKPLCHWRYFFSCFLHFRLLVFWCGWGRRLSENSTGKRWQEEGWGKSHGNPGVSATNSKFWASMGRLPGRSLPGRSVRRRCSSLTPSRHQTPYISGGNSLAAAAMTTHRTLGGFNNRKLLSPSPGGGNWRSRRGERWLLEAEASPAGVQTAVSSRVRPWWSPCVRLCCSSFLIRTSPKGSKCVCESLSRVWLLQPRGLWPTRLLCPWDSPGKSTGEGCQSLLHLRGQDPA